MPVSDWFCGLTRNKILIVIMLFIGLALILHAGIRTYKNWQYVPILLISIGGFVILALIYWFKGKEW
jgi:uncharacterized membrane protein (UPF0136 family)